MELLSSRQEVFTTHAELSTLASELVPMPGMRRRT